MGRKLNGYSTLYTVYDNKTDLPIIVDGTADECAKVMGIKKESLYSYAVRTNKGTFKKYTILRSRANERKK